MEVGRVLILEQKLEALEKERCNLKEEVDEGRHQMQAMKETTIQGGSGEIPDSQFKIAVLKWQSQAGLLLRG